MSIHALPVEILSRIFAHGAAPASPSPFLLRPHYSRPLSKFTPTLETQIAVSHVCQRWRIIALNTSSLWTTLVFLKARHIQRASALLKRLFPLGPPVSTADGRIQRAVPTSKTIIILISTVARESYKEGENIAKEEMHEIFWMLRPYLPAWRALHLVVRDTICKAVAREHLGNCGAGPSLETLQLYHFEDFRGVDDLYEATYRPPVRVFDNDLPRLKNVSLIGVNLPWDKSPYLYDGRVKKLELALHPDNTRPPYEYWERMLRGCGDKSTDEVEKTREEMCTLEDLSLHYSGPKVGQGVDKYVWRSIDDGRLSKRKIWMPRLERLSLTDLAPDYLCKIMEALVLPAVRTLDLDLPEDDFTTFVEMLGEKEVPPAREDSVSAVASPASDSALSCHGSSSSSETSHEATLSTRALSGMTLFESDPPHSVLVTANYPQYQSALERSASEARTFPALWRVEHLTVTALQCSEDSWRGFLRALRGLKVLEIDFARINDEVWDVLMERNDVAGIDTKAPKGPTLFPLLHTVKMNGLEGDKVVELIRWRSMPHGKVQGVRHWFVRWSEKRRGRDKVLDEVVEAGVRAFIGDQMATVKVRYWDDDDDDDDDDDEVSKVDDDGDDDDDDDDGDEDEEEEMDDE